MSEPKKATWRVPIATAVCAVLLASGFITAQRTGIFNGTPVLGDLVIRGGSSLPRPGFEEASSPLGIPPQPVRQSPSWAPISTNADGSPVTWSPCRPIHYVMRPDNAPTNGLEITQAAVTRISETTGLQFIYDGTTDEDPSTERESFQRERYGNRWAPVLISWATEAEVPDLEGATLGRGGPQSVVLDGLTSYVTGEVILDAQELDISMNQPGGAKFVQIILEHELGHVIGLEHVNDPSQLMFPESTALATEFGAGDLNGLYVMGTGRCTPGL